MITSKKTRMKDIMRRNNVFCWLLLAWPMLHFCIFYVYLNFDSILLAFRAYNAKLDLIWVGFDNFTSLFRLLNGGILGTALGNSMLLFLALNLIGFPINMALAFYICKKVKCVGFLRYCLMIPSLVSGIVFALVFTKLVDLNGPINSILASLGMNRLGMLSTEKSIIPTCIFYMLWTGFTSTIIIYPNAMNAACSDEIVESLKLDGGGDMDEFFHLRLPLMYPTIVTYVVSGIAGLFTTSGPLFVFFEYKAPSSAWTVGYYMFRETMVEGQTAYGMQAAANLLVTCVAAPLTFLVKWIMERFGPSED